MPRLKKYKKRKLSNSKKTVLLFLLVLLTLGVVYAALVSDLSILGNIVVKKYVVPRTKTFPTQIEAVLDDETCSTRYEDAVTDEVNNTVGNAKNVYFFKCSNKRNIIYNNMCWQMIRTTETGGIKMIYNGEVVDGKCESTRGDHKGIVQSNYTDQTLSSSYLYGSSFSYDTTTSEFTLTDTITATWSDSTYQNLLGKFTCKNTNGTCTTLYQINGYKSNTQGYASAYTIGDTNYAQIGTSSYNANYRSPAMVGYMFNKVYNNVANSAPTSGSLMGNDVSYSNGTYTLLPADGESELGTTLDATHHYTCNTTSSTCNKVRYYYYNNYYIELDGAENIQVAVNEMLYNNDVNRYNSSIKGIVDAWYAQNLSSKTNMLEDTVFCNARVMTNQATNGWNKDGSLTTYMYFKNYTLNNDLSCINETDQFAVSNNKAKLTYPVSLATIEELYTLTNNNSSTYYSTLTNTGNYWWGLSPRSFDSSFAVVRYVDSAGNANFSASVSSNYGVRLVVSLSTGAVITEGDGSESDPWIVDESPLNTTIGTYNTRLKNAYLSDTYRDKIKTITLSDTINIPNNAVVSWDIGTIQNNKVMAYLMTNSQDNTMYDLYIQGDGELKANYDSSYLFSNMPNLTSINNLTILDTSNVRSTYRMFAASTSLTTLDISGFNTTNVTNMHDMFAGMTIDQTQVTMHLQNIVGLNSLDTSNVTDFGGMFINNAYMQTIDISNWDTHNATSMYDMFNNANDLSSVLTTIIFGPNFDTSKVTNMSLMFADNPNLVNLDVSSFSTSSVTNMKQMFSNDKALTTINVSNFNVSNVTNMSGMFTNCHNITSLDVGSWNTINVVDMSNLFYGCNKLTTVNVTDWKTSNVTNMSGMFFENYQINNIDVSDWDTSKVTTMSIMFRNCVNLESLDVSDWNTSNVTDMAYTFAMLDENGRARDSKLTVIDVSRWNVSKVEVMNHMFLGSKVYNLNLLSWNTESLIKLSNTFADCHNLTSIDLRNFKMDNVTEIWHLFAGSKNLSTIVLPNYNLSTIPTKDVVFGGITNTSTIVYARTAENRNWILSLDSTQRPTWWSTSNVLINTLPS